MASSRPLQNAQVAILVDFSYEDLEVHYPKIRLEEAGCKITIISLHKKGTKVTGKFGYPVIVDYQIGDKEVWEGGDLKSKYIDDGKLTAPKFDAVIAPGGFSPDYFRRDPLVKLFVSWMSFHDRVIAGICHGPWMMCSARKLEFGLELGKAMIERLSSKGIEGYPNALTGFKNDYESFVTQPAMTQNFQIPQSDSNPNPHLPPTICHNHKVTAFHSIKDDLENAGGKFVDAAVVCDGGLVTSRTPNDMTEFCRGMMEEMGKRRK